MKRHATFEDCIKVWRGEDFCFGEEDKDKLKALLTLFLLMFEQEVNFGELDFQQYTNFRISEGFRPRDMIMGFLDMMFNGEDDFILIHSGLKKMELSFPHTSDLIKKKKVMLI